jgi:hypothetical protein
MVRTMADDFHGPRAEDLDQLHQLQKSTKRPAKGIYKFSYNVLFKCSLSWPDVGNWHVHASLHLRPCDRQLVDCTSQIRCSRR